jgi:hypothetical protein
MFACIAVCGISAWKGRRGVDGTGPLALLVVTVVLSLSTNRILAKQTWVIFAYAYMTGYAFHERRSAASWNRTTVRHAVGADGVPLILLPDGPLEAPRSRTVRR